ncbi:MAG: phosphate ABC transporter permease subunit PstC [Acidimicrobiia bacterium]|nr:phosphate ABC transporter permease subunit PstC [Acidimicrobiia bacterium]
MPAPHAWTHTVTTTSPSLVSSERPPGRFTDRVSRVVVFVAGGLVLAILALITATLVSKAMPAFRSEGMAYFTSDIWDPANAKFGTLGFTFGTVVASGIAVLLAVPVSIGIALFTTEVAPRWMRKPVTYLVDLLAAVPSVVYGLWGLLVLVPMLPGFYQNWHDLFDGVPVLGNIFDGAPVAGKSFMTAGIILAVMITPIITAIARETFATVPDPLKDAARALGATRWEMIRASVIPHSRGGLTAGILIGLGRALGETIAVALVIGSSPQITAKIFGSGDNLAAVIANQWGEATGNYRSALIGMGVVLFIVTLVVGVLARTIVIRADRRAGGTA